MTGRTDLMYRDVTAKLAVYAMLLQMPWRGRQELGGRKDWESFNTVQSSGDLWHGPDGRCLSAVLVNRNEVRNRQACILDRLALR